MSSKKMGWEVRKTECQSYVLQTAVKYTYLIPENLEIEYLVLDKQRAQPFLDGVGDSRVGANLLRSRLLFDFALRTRFRSFDRRLLRMRSEPDLAKLVDKDSPFHRHAEAVSGHLRLQLRHGV